MGKPSKETLLISSLREYIRSIRPVISNCNDKGGVGKTTVTAHEAWYAAQVLGLKTLVCDFEKHLTKLLCGNRLPDLPDYAVATDLFSEDGIKKPIYQLPDSPNLYLLPADHHMKAIDTIPMDAGIVLNPRFNIEALREQFDLIIIDTPPVTGNRQQAGILAATNAILITEMSALSIEAVSDAINISNALIDDINVNNDGLSINYPNYIVLPNKFNSRRSRHCHYLKVLKGFGISLSPAIEDREPLGIAIDNGNPVWTYSDGNSRLASKNIKSVLEFLFTGVK
ncbi:ParA family protein [Pectobacterium versatile]|uniref:ParA family protein n=1 Tax=Pectobacterium versatile TaxID=2488639 RepID=UPI001F37E57C|nr:ParA family protein [Pectobacterium versatile]